MPTLNDERSVLSSLRRVCWHFWHNRPSFYRPQRAYGQSKLATLLFAMELNRRSVRSGWGIRSNASHPGATLTNWQTTGPTLGRGSSTLLERFEMQVTRMIPGFWQEIAQGALPTLYAATSPLAVGGGYYGPGGFAELTGMPAVARIPRRARNEPLHSSLLFESASSCLVARV
jgi:NAD(P)-dependent dehydrogenase (short-subunit alcohol dehydrogenase family)